MNPLSLQSQTQPYMLATKLIIERKQKELQIKQQQQKYNASKLHKKSWHSSGHTNCRRMVLKFM
jgi:hypothetical protein